MKQKTMKQKTIGKQSATPTQLIKIAEARYLAGVTILKLSLCCHAHCECNSYSLVL